MYYINNRHLLCKTLSTNLEKCFFSLLVCLQSERRNTNDINVVNCTLTEKSHKNIFQNIFCSWIQTGSQNISYCCSLQSPHIYISIIQQLLSLGSKTALLTRPINIKNIREWNRSRIILFFFIIVLFIYFSSSLSLL